MKERHQKAFPQEESKHTYRTLERRNEFEVEWEFSNYRQVR